MLQEPSPADSHLAVTHGFPKTKSERERLPGNEAGPPGLVSYREGGHPLQSIEYLSTVAVGTPPAVTVSCIVMCTT